MRNQSIQLNNRTRIWLVIVVVMALIVAAVTTYSLILPAKTLEAAEQAVAEDYSVAAVSTSEDDYGAAAASADDYGIATADATSFDSEQVTAAESASTSSFIELNLYDYYGDNASSNGKTSVNSMFFGGDTRYPGFQWNGGAYMYTSTFSKRGVDYIDFGNCMITDYDYISTGTSRAHGKSSNAKMVGNKGGLINALDISDYGVTNRPIGLSLNSSITDTDEDVLKRTLGEDGYPALADGGLSLKYLFVDEGGYADKLNESSIDGLFMRDDVSGEYYYNSRWNHAQYSSEDDTFTLYDQIITPNFILYPFGNFLPLNSITDSDTSTQVSAITNMRTYVNDTINELYEGTPDSTETHTIYMLNKYYSVIGSSWTAATALNDFFNGSSEPMTSTANFQLSDPLLQEMYNIDWNVDTNFFFGMEMKMNFIQPKDGLTGNDTNGDGTADYPMRFYFTGDDDVWVYVDGVLFLDLSGIHRHVGGEIDFENGKVYYYALDTAGNGDVADEPYQTYTFEQILLAAGRSTDSLKGSSGSKTTFKDYTNHSFNFYYMERGSGSSVCRLNFNFPLLKQNTISVSKDVTSDGGAIGDPYYRFQVLKADSGSKTEELFIAEGTEYTIYDSDDNVIGTGVTGEGGIFGLKKGQRAEFSNIAENSGQYYVRELFDEDVADQFTGISVSGETVTMNNDVEVGSDKFVGAESTVKDASDGSTLFRFVNDVNTEELGSLKIQKLVRSYENKTGTFDFEVRLDGEELPEGTEYAVETDGGAVKTAKVSRAGIITLAAGETATISNILAGTAFQVSETEESAKDYEVIYTQNDDVTVVDGIATGHVKAKTPGYVQVTVSNVDGVAVNLPVEKILYDAAAGADGGSSGETFAFELQQTDQEGQPLDESPMILELTAGSDGSATGYFTLAYAMKDQAQLPAQYYYRLTEMDTGDCNMEYDDAVYTVVVQLESDSDGGLKATPLMRSSDSQETTATAVFANRKLYSLSVSKKVTGSTGTDDTEFDFTISLSDSGGEPLTGRFCCTGTGAALESSCVQDSGTYMLEFDSEGRADVRLKDGQVLTVNGLGAGTVWSVSEENSADDGYIAYYSVNGADSLTEGCTASGTAGSEDSSWSGAGSGEDSTDTGNAAVEFTNEKVYVLPESGGCGRWPVSLAGLLLIITGAVLAMRRRRFHRI